MPLKWRSPLPTEMGLENEIRSPPFQISIDQNNLSICSCRLIFIYHSIRTDSVSVLMLLRGRKRGCQIGGEERSFLYWEKLSISALYFCGYIKITIYSSVWCPADLQYGVLTNIFLWHKKKKKNSWRKIRKIFRYNTNDVVNMF